MHIKTLLHITPQCNGLVESFNGTIQKLLFKLVDLKRWDKVLNKALWTYRMTQKLATGFTPFHIVYGEDAMMRVNLLFPSIQMMKCLRVQDEFQMDIWQEAMSDLFWKRDDAICLYEELCERWDKRSQALARRRTWWKVCWSQCIIVAWIRLFKESSSIDGMDLI